MGHGESNVLMRPGDEIVEIEDSIRNGDFEMYHDFAGREIEDLGMDNMLADARDEPTGTQFHLCNAALKEIPDHGKQLLHTMWEDSDLEGDYDARERFAWLERYTPGMFALIDTGDYIVPECIKASYSPLHQYCETYDATYALWLVPLSIWFDCREKVLAADKAWREEKSRCELIGNFT
jgi:hypothetical protein